MSSKNTVPPESSGSEQERHIQQLVQLTALELKAEDGRVIQQCMAASRKVIEPLLQDHQESTLEQAISRAEQELSHEAGLVLRSNIEALASECTVEIEGGTAQRCGLYAVPVQVFSREPGRYIGGEASADLLEVLVNAARQEGLVTDKARVAFVPYLYQEGELTWHEFIDIRDFTEMVAHRLQDPDGFSHPGGMLQSAAKERLDDPSFYMESFKVMYLVFGVVDEPSAVPFVRLTDGTIDLDETDQALAAWVERAGDTVRQVFGGEKVLVHVGHPRALCAALREGAENFRASHFQVQMLEHLKVTGTTAEELSLVVTAHGEDGYLEEYWVTALAGDDGRTLFSVVYPFFPWDAFDELEEGLERHLQHAGFARIQMPQELLPPVLRTGRSSPSNSTLH